MLKSKVVKNLMSEYPDLSDLFDYFDNAFDHKSALTEGKIIPADGVDPEVCIFRSLSNNSFRRD